MENFRNNPRALIFIAQLFSAGLMVIYLLMLTLNARGQTFKEPLFVRAGQSVHSAQLVEKVRKIYTSQIGVREKANNSGKEVEQYLSYVKLPKGNPWCAAFVCWVYGRAGVANPRSGWCPALFGDGSIVWPSGEPRTKSQESRLAQSAKKMSYNGGLLIRPDWQWATGNGQQRTSESRPSISNFLVPNTGDVFGLYFPEKRRIAHVGFIDEWKDPWVVTVEGNTNVLGSREGDGVYRKRRIVRSVFRVARYVD